MIWMKIIHSIMNKQNALMIITIIFGDTIFHIFVPNNICRQILSSSLSYGYTFMQRYLYIYCDYKHIYIYVYVMGWRMLQGITE